MRLGWDEIKRRAKAFSEEWKDAHYERGQIQTFYNEFFEIFGIKRKLVAVYEQRVGGRLKSDYRNSNALVYNTFPWPDATPAQRTKIEALAQAVLDARTAHPSSSLADFNDPDTMPANLRRAHAALDLAVDRLYRAAPFATDRDRVEHLFGRYEALVNPLERLGAAKNLRIARKVKDKA